MYESFQPPLRILMGPGPSDVSPRVLSAMARPTIGHLDPEFIRLIDEIKQLLRYAFKTENELTLPISAPGSSGMEAVFVNLLERGDKVIVCENGAFGGRMRENVERCGATAVMVTQEWGLPIDIAQVETALKQNPDAVALAFVHAETSTGVLSDAKKLCALARQYDCFSIVDAVTSLGGVELAVDDWGIDAIYSGTQKCLSCSPGLSPVSFSPKALQRIQSRETKIQSWFLDMSLVTQYWGSHSKRSYHHTAPINALYGLHESLLMLKEEGLENAWKRHKEQHMALRAGLNAMGLQFKVDEESRLPQLNAVSVPDNIDEGRVRAVLLNEFGIEIGAGLGSLAGKIWRIGLMGASACERNVLSLLGALESALTDQDFGLEKGAGVKAARAYYSKGA
ncbi:MAG: alanine--glyoxylate aminotransferase family protein [Pseudohongiellaceae bacterium]|nr:alanine--glyoxylate aminotransferase family protein [Pseudohongiellaceae bacterium]